jgi:hypothetical protein
MRLSRCPELCFAGVFIDDIVKMEFQGFDVGLVDPFKDVEDDARETIFVEIYFLIVGHLAYFAGRIS